MYTKLLRKLAMIQRSFSGHCEPTPTGGGGNGHCY